MICPSCNQENEEKAKFCGNCGSKLINDAFSQASQAQVVEQQVANQAPQAQVVEQRVADQASQAIIVEQNAKSKSAFIGMLNRYKFAIIGGVGAGALVLVAIFIIMPMLFSSKSDAPIIYLGKNEIKMQVNGKNNEDIIISDAVASSMEWNEFIESVGTQLGLQDAYVDYTNYDSMFPNSILRFLMNAFIQVSDDNSKMFFIKKVSEDEKTSIYYRDLTKKPGSWDSDEGEKIASNVSIFNGSAFKISDDGKHVVYIKNYDYSIGGKLYTYNLENEVAIDSGVYDYWYIQEQSIIYYTKITGEDYELDLYMVNVNKPEEATKIDSNVAYTKEIDWTTGDLYYTKYISDEYTNNIALYHKPIKGESTKILSKVDTVQSSIEDGSFYYTIVEEDEISLMSLVNDDFATTDSAMQEPEYSDYERVVEESYSDWWTGETTYYESLETDYDAYYEAHNLYTEKLYRDELRAQLEEEVIPNNTTTLYLYHNGESTKIAENVYSIIYSSPKHQVAIYNLQEQGLMDKINISEIINTYDVKSLFNDMISYPETMYIASGATLDQVLYEDEIYPSLIELSKDGKKLYLIEDENEEFVHYELKDGKYSNRTVIDDAVHSYVYLEDEGKIYYYKDIEQYSGDLYAYDQGKSMKISNDATIGFTTYDPIDDQVLYVSDYSQKTQRGHLNIYKAGQSNKVAEEIGAYFYLNKNQIFFLENYNTSKGYGELYRLGEKGKNELITDRAYAMYYPFYSYEF